MPGSLFVFGGTGFVGRNLLEALRSRGYGITVLVRNPREAERAADLGASPVIGDVLDPETYRAALRQGSTVIYLIHAMGPQAVRGDFAGLDRRAAEMLARVCRERNVLRIIHLSGLSHPSEKLSRHLESRAEVCRIIQGSGLPAAIIRASIIFAPGSASYEILNAALSLPVVPLPPWRETKVQPIAIHDVIRCLAAAIEHPNLLKSDFNRLDIGGPEIFTYDRLLRRFAAARGIRKLFFNIPLEGRWLAARILSKRSGIALGETSALLESLENTSIVQGKNAIQTVFGFEPTPIFPH